MLLKHSRCGLSVFLFPMIILILYLGFHKSRAAHSKVIIKKLVHKHGYSSFVICCDTLYSYFENLSIGFVKVFYEKAAEILLSAAGEIN